MKEWILLLTLSTGGEQATQQTLMQDFQSKENCLAAASKIGDHAAEDRRKLREELKLPQVPKETPLLRYSCMEVDK